MVAPNTTMGREGKTKTKKKKPRNNRRAGHGFERDIRKFFIDLGFLKCETSRYASREMDDKKVDLVHTDPFYVQCKYTQQINAHNVLASMPQEKDKINLLFHKKKNLGTVVSMRMEDFAILLQGFKTVNN